MSIVPMSLANIQLTVQNDAQYLRTFIEWVQMRNVTYSQNMNATNMNAAGVVAADQTAINALAADIGRLVTFLGGTLPGVAANVSVDVANVLGVM